MAGAWSNNKIEKVFCYLYFFLQIFGFEILPPQFVSNSGIKDSPTLSCLIFRKLLDHGRTPTVGNLKDEDKINPIHSDILLGHFRYSCTFWIVKIRILGLRSRLRPWLSIILRLKQGCIQNTPGTAVGPGGSDRALAVKSRKMAKKSP